MMTAKESKDNETAYEFCRINLEKTGKNICRLMQAKGIKPYDLSVILGISEQAVYKWCGGRNLPAIENMYILKSVLDLESIEDLIVTEKWTLSL